MALFILALEIAACAKAQPLDSSPDGAPAPSALQRSQPEPARPAAPPLANPLPGVRADLTAAVGAALRGAAGDLDGDGKPELVLATAERLRVVTTDGRELDSLPAPGGIQVLSTADLDGDGRAEILAGWGRTVERREAKARVNSYELSAGQLVAEDVLVPDSARNDVVAVVPFGPGKLLAAYFTSKYMVTAALAWRGTKGWSSDELATIRMATSWASGDVNGDGEPEIVVGRSYGDDTGLDGDAFVLGDGGTRTPIPTTRGVRALALADLGGGRADVLLADGWHQNYGRNAQALLTAARWDGAAFRTHLVEDAPGQYGVERILTADLDGDGALEIVAKGNAYVRVYQRLGEAWSGMTVAGACRDVFLLGRELVIIGDRSERVSLAAQ